jgi:hypothetical protein
MGMTQTKPEWMDFLPYIHVRSENLHPLYYAYPELVSDISALPKANRGLFARDCIRAGTLIMPVELDSECHINDAMVDLTQVLAASDSTAMYQAVCQLHTAYYDPVVAAARVNTVMVTDPQGITMYQARTNIPKGAELLRMYGFVTWIFELLPRMNARTITGFAVFVHQYYRSMVVTEVYYGRVRTLVDVLENYYACHGLTLRVDTLAATDAQITAECQKRILTDIMALYVAKMSAVRQ